LLFLDPGSGIRDPEWVKIRIRDKHPGSATLQKYGFGIRDPEKPIPDPGSGVKKAPDPGSGSATRVIVCIIVMVRVYTVLIDV
jgi:hypothetical protein